MAAVLLTPSVAVAQTALDKLVAAAKSENELNFTSFAAAFGGVDAMPKLEDAFNKKFGLKAKLTFTPGASMPALAARITQEYKSGVHAASDVFLGNQSSMTQMKKDDALAEVDWSGVFPWITPEMEILKGRTVLVWTGLATMTYNSDLLKPADAPTKYEDLIDPVKAKAWAGKLAAPMFPDWMIELSLIWPKEMVLDFATKLSPSITGLIRYAEVDRLLTGEFVLMTNESDGPAVASVAADKGGHITAVPGSTPSQAYYNQLAVPKNSASPNLAKLFVGFMISPEGQAIADSIGHEASHLVAGTRVNKFLAEKKVTAIDPRLIADFYEKGGDPALSEQIRQIMKR